MLSNMSHMGGNDGIVSTTHSSSNALNSMTGSNRRSSIRTTTSSGHTGVTYSETRYSLLLYVSFLSTTLQRTAKTMNCSL